MSDSKNVAFLGLGVMGGPIAGHLARAGHHVTVYNRTQSRAEDWLAHHRAEGLLISGASRPDEAAHGADVVLTCVGQDRDLDEVLLAPTGALNAMPAGALLIDHTTASPAIARNIAAAAASRGVLAVDAPVSGGQSGAQAGRLSIMCGGTCEAVEAARPLMSAYAERIIHIGESGSGQSAKSVNQICIAGTLAGLSEAIRFAQAQNLDLAKVLEAISGGAAQSWQMDNRWETMTRGEFDFGFAIDWMRKDLAIALEAACSSQTPLPVTALVDQFYAAVQAKGGGRQDTSALIRHLPEAGQ